MTLHEPATVITDFMLGTLTAVFAAKLFRRATTAGSPAVRLWGAAFVASAVAAFLGGFFHGFGPDMGQRSANALWRATLYTGGVASFFLMAATVTAALRGMIRRIWLVGLAAKASAYAALVTQNPEFRWLVFDYGSSMLGVAAFQALRMRGGPAPGAGWILAGIAGSAVAALVQQAGVSLHEHFNHNDIYHVLQMGATTLLYCGARDAVEPFRPTTGHNGPGSSRK
jgi:hypothetical protein